MNDYEIEQTYFLQFVDNDVTHPQW